MNDRTDGPATTTDTTPTAQEAALLAAERFLADTAEAIHPDTSAPALLRCAARYRAHLAAVVAASRRSDGRQAEDGGSIHEGPGSRPFPHTAAGADRLQRP